MHPIPPSPRRRDPRLAAVADILCACSCGVLLALCLVHWAACEGMC